MIRLVGVQPGYLPGDKLSYEYRLSRVPADKVVAIETSIVWYTEGKGNEDLGVHLFQRITGEDIASRDLQQPQCVSVDLPESPLSYEGRLLKIRWCVRVRAFLSDGNELVGQQPFYLGSITREV